LQPLALVSLYTATQENETLLYLRTELQSGDRIEGPAIIIETNATTVVETGWQAQITPKHHLLMSRLQPLPRPMSVATDVDPVRLEGRRAIRRMVESVGSTADSSCVEFIRWNAHKGLSLSIPPYARL
jgi:Hydantoinase/oxoprolinase C-terminal domain